MKKSILFKGNELVTHISTTEERIKRLKLSLVEAECLVEQADDSLCYNSEQRLRFNRIDIIVPKKVIIQKIKENLINEEESLRKLNNKFDKLK